MEKHRKSLLYRLTYLEAVCYDALQAIADVRTDFRALTERECSTSAEKPAPKPGENPRKPAEIKASGESPAGGPAA